MTGHDVKRMAREEHGVVINSATRSRSPVQRWWRLEVEEMPSQDKRKAIAWALVENGSASAYHPDDGYGRRTPCVRWVQG